MDAQGEAPRRSSARSVTPGGGRRSTTGRDVAAIPTPYDRVTAPGPATERPASAGPASDDRDTPSLADTPPAPARDAVAEELALLQRAQSALQAGRNSQALAANRVRKVCADE